MLTWHLTLSCDDPAYTYSVFFTAHPQNPQGLSCQARSSAANGNHRHGPSWWTHCMTLAFLPGAIGQMYWFELEPFSCLPRLFVYDKLSEDV